MAGHARDKTVINRLSRIEGHVRAVREMIRQGRDCAEVLIQLAAIRSAVDRASRVLLKDHIRSCVAGRPRGPKLSRMLGDLDKALDSFVR
ncbi:MAG: Copper-sensing transcriptional repressor CsoR [Phycisphaerae bacterium]|nr:Copper-sensing transcriptional repressor CsoR [Phycisphaerae bacterium]